MEHFNIPDKDASVSQLEDWRKSNVTFNATRRYRYVADLAKRRELEQLSESSAEENDVVKLKGWRKLSLALNPSRRFRYVVDLARRKQLEQRQQFNVLGLAGLAAHRFINVLSQDGPQRKYEDKFDGRFDADSLSSLVENRDLHKLKAHGGLRRVAERLEVDPKVGLNDQQVEYNREEYGVNTFLTQPPRTFLVFVGEACQDRVLQILFLCAIVSIGLGIATDGLEEGWFDGAGLLMAIFLDVSLTAFNDSRQDRLFREVAQEERRVLSKTQVIRNDCRKEISKFNLVVGDIVHLSIGDEIPADGLLIEGHELTIDESHITGVSEFELKSPEQNPFLLSGTNVQDGSGLMLVTGVGTQTRWGQLMSIVGEDQTETPLQVKLNGLATFLCKLGLAFALVTFIVLLGRHIFEKYSAGGIMEWDREDAGAILGYFAIAVAMIKVAASEDLPQVVSYNLARTTKKLQKKALVRHWAACETMGSATAICSDKTGTLTTNKRRVVKAWVAECTGDATEVKSQIPLNVRDTLIELIYANTSGKVEIGPDGKRVPTGSPTETALLEFGMALGGEFQGTRDNFEVMRMKPFRSDRKRMGLVTVRHPDRHMRALWKGASEKVLQMCDRTIDAEGNEVPLTEEKQKDLKSRITSFGEQALSPLCLAYSDDVQEDVCHEVPEKNLVCLAILGISDTVRLGVPHAVAGFTSAGIKVRMITGDHHQVSMAIARECGIYTDTDGEAILGTDFRDWTEAETDRRIPRLEVMTRSSPSDKLHLVRHLRNLGEVVAVTGDGANDAPALHEADIGMAMGLDGTTVAKQAADVILLNDDFATIFVLFKWGRAMCRNLRKYFQFHLTVTIVALLFCVTGEATLTAMQLLWIDVITEHLGPLALASEPPHDDLLKKEIDKSFITMVMWRNVLGQAIYQLAVLLLLQYKGQDILHLEGSEAEVEAQLNTIIFNSFVFCQIFNEFNSREMENLNVFARIFNDRWFLFIIPVTVVLQLIIISVLGKLVNTGPLTVNQWLITVGIGAFSMLVAVVLKLIPIPSEGASKKSNPRTNGDYEALPGGPYGDYEAV